MNDFDKQQVAENFSKAAPHYDRAAEAQRRMAEMLATMLPPADGIDPILELGCGTGLLTEKLTQKYPRARIHAIDFAPGMIDYCRNQFASYPRLTFEIADAENYAPDFQPRLAASNCTFQWLHDQRAVLERMHAYLADGGFLALGAMLAGSLPELNESFAVAAGRPLPALPLWSENDYRGTLEATGFQILPPSHAVEFHVEHRSAHEALRVLKEIGATLPQATAAPLSPGVLRRLENHYRSRYTDSVTGHVRSTWRAFILLARKI